MFKNEQAFSSFSVDDVDAAKRFYSETLGLDVAEEQPMGLLRLNVGGGPGVMIYPKENHQPATFTVLNLPVDDIDRAVDDLTSKGVTMERYEGFGQDEKGIARPGVEGQGPPIAWFTDPAGNIIALLQI